MPPLLALLGLAVLLYEVLVAVHHHTEARAAPLAALAAALAALAGRGSHLSHLSPPPPCATLVLDLDLDHVPHAGQHAP